MPNNQIIHSLADNLDSLSIRKVNNTLICSFCCRNITDLGFSCAICESGQFDMCSPCKQLGRTCPGRHRLERVQIEAEHRPEPKPEPSNPSNVPGGDSDDQKLKASLLAAIVREKPNVKWDDVAGELSIIFLRRQLRNLRLGCGERRIARSCNSPASISRSVYWGSQGSKRNASVRTARHWKKFSCESDRN